MIITYGIYTTTLILMAVQRVYLQEITNYIYCNGDYCSIRGIEEYLQNYSRTNSKDNSEQHNYMIRFRMQIPTLAVIESNLNNDQGFLFLLDIGNFHLSFNSTSVEILNEHSQGYLALNESFAPTSIISLDVGHEANVVICIDDVKVGSLLVGPNLPIHVDQESGIYFNKHLIEVFQIVILPNAYTPNLKENSNLQCQSQINELQQTIIQLKAMIAKITNRMDSIEYRLESCERQPPNTARQSLDTPLLLYNSSPGRSCSIAGGKVKVHGAQWSPQGNTCTTCLCMNGITKCITQACPTLNCSKKMKVPGECCQKCQDCLHEGIHYDHGEVIMINKCTECKCKQGSTTCRIIEITDCPELTCPHSRRVKDKSNCCPYCKEIDQCINNTCHSDASCTTVGNIFICHCKPGFKGDGYTCEDINECDLAVSRNRNLCNPQASTCVNNIGSYTCLCHTGFRRIINDYDNVTCIDIDECTYTYCTAHAQCYNTLGSFTCKCKPKYTKQILAHGYYCKPICKRRCENGGICISPDVCKCNLGFNGSLCQYDIDECKSTDLNPCPRKSSCVNTIGSFYCVCNTGYKISRYLKYKKITYEKVCKDINECSSKISVCDADKYCVNTVGGYMCKCIHANTCNNVCTVDIAANLRKHWSSNIDECSVCYCKNDVIVCRKKTCKCSGLHNTRWTTSSPTCCHNCHRNYSNPIMRRKYQKYSCELLSEDTPIQTITDGSFYRSVSLKNITSKKNDKKLNCQICRCLNGSNICARERCPKLKCHRHIRDHGQCCSRCQHSKKVELLSTPKTIVYELTMKKSTCDQQVYANEDLRKCSGAWGHQYNHASRWRENKCRSCHCNDGHTCCKQGRLCLIRQRQFIMSRIKSRPRT